MVKHGCTAHVRASGRCQTPADRPCRQDCVPRCDEQRRSAPAAERLIGVKPGILPEHTSYKREAKAECAGHTDAAAYQPDNRDSISGIHGSPNRWRKLCCPSYSYEQYCALSFRSIERASSSPSNQLPPVCHGITMIAGMDRQLVIKQYLLATKFKAILAHT